MTLWWQGAVIYQIYPRSFMDSNGDGVGDLAGITKKLDYVASLGVDAIWISPFFKSPMKDFGYDISDYRAVDPLFGASEDFDLLLERAHQLSLKVIIDQALSHTSDQHSWFAESRQDRDNPKADWYVWADPAADGGPPNNWLSIFGGSAWTWGPERQQYYMHNFLASQPDLNFHSDTLKQQILAEVEFWLARGVDGVRLDAVNFLYHDPQLRNNPPKPAHERKGRGFSPDNPYAAQYHIYDNTRPETLEFLETLRELLDRYPHVVSIGEINTENSPASIAEYTAQNKRIHAGYSFELLNDECSAEYIRQTVEAQEQYLQGSWPCWAISNHDVTRVMTRWGGANPSPQLAKTLTAMLCSLRGVICVYQGEELGLTEAAIERSELQDPFGIEFWPHFKGRDGCRTPMPWEKSDKYAGFSTTKPWLPIPDEHQKQAVDQQLAQPDSILQHYQGFMRWRKQHPALLFGSIRFIDTPSGANILAFIREVESQKVLACFNLGNTPQTLSLPADSCIQLLDAPIQNVAEVKGQQLSMSAYSSFFGLVD